MLERTMGIENKVKFFENEAEFSFRPDDNFIVCYRDQIESKNYDLKKLNNMRLIKRTDSNLNSSINSKIRVKEIKTNIDLINKLNKKKKYTKLNFNTFYNMMIQNQQKLNLKISSSFKLINKFAIFKNYLDDYCYNLWIKKSYLIILQIEYIIWTKFLINLIFFQLDQPINYYKINDEKLRIIYYILIIDNFLTLLMVIEILFNIFINGFRLFFSKFINIFDTCIVVINVLSFLSHLYGYGELTR